MTDRKPPSILDPNFRYFSSADTNLRRTFARIRKEQQRQQKPTTNVAPIKARKA